MEGPVSASHLTTVDGDSPRDLATLANEINAHYGRATAPVPSCWARRLEERGNQELRFNKTPVVACGSGATGKGKALVLWRILMIDLHNARRLRKLLGPLSAEERQQLKNNIEADGRVIDPILYWHDGKRNVVIDGMHRWEIVRGTEIPFCTEQLKFANYEEAEV
jgi:hypothetical protein